MLQVTQHTKERFAGRVRKLISDKQVCKYQGKKVIKSFTKLIGSDLSSFDSYGVCLGSLEPQSSSTALKVAKSGRTYLTINSTDNGLLKDSTGNEVWAIVRQGRIISVFLRKEVQRETAHLGRNAGGLGVNKIIDKI